MDWSKVGKTVAGFAPALGGLLGGPGGLAVGSMIARTLGVDDTPDAVQAALAADPGAALKLQTLYAEHRLEFERLELQGIAETNATARIAMASDDEYVRRARPGLLYMVTDVVKLQVSVTLLGGVLALLVHPERGAMIVTGIADLNAAIMPSLGLALTAAGIYVRSRSTHDKPVSTGQAVPKGLLQGLAERIGR